MGFRRVHSSLVGKEAHIKKREKSEPAVRSFDDCLAKATPAQHAALQRVREIIHTTVPEAEECVSYGLAAFRHQGKLLGGIAACKGHCSYYPMGNLTEHGQHWRSETVAELGGAILLTCLGLEKDADAGGGLGIRATTIARLIARDVADDFLIDERDATGMTVWPCCYKVRQVGIRRGVFEADWPADWPGCRPSRIRGLA